MRRLKRRRESPAHREKSAQRDPRALWALWGYQVVKDPSAPRAIEASWALQALQAQRGLAGFPAPRAIGGPREKRGQRAQLTRIYSNASSLAS